MAMKMTVEFPDDLHTRLKTAAAQQKTTIRALLIKGAELALKEADPDPNKPKPKPD